MMPVNKATVSEIQSLLSLYDKDKGFKKAISDLKTASQAALSSGEQAAVQASALKSAVTKATTKENRANKAVAALAKEKTEIAKQTKELEAAKVSFKNDMQAAQNQSDAFKRSLEIEDARLKELDGKLKQLQGDLLRKSDLLEKEKQAFEAWRAKVRSALAA